MAVPETIQQLRQARASHKAWLMRAEALLAGMPLDIEQHKPLTAIECSFGLWMHGTGKRLNGFSVFNQLEANHVGFHRVYADIFSLLRRESKGIKSFFGQSKKEKKRNELEANLLLPRLQAFYDAIVSLLSTLEKDYLAMKENNKAKEQIKANAKAKSSTEDLHTKSYQDISDMMDTLGKDVDDWLK